LSLYRQNRQVTETCRRSGTKSAPDLQIYGVLAVDVVVPAVDVVVDDEVVDDDVELEGVELDDDVELDEDVELELEEVGRVVDDDVDEVELVPAEDEVVPCGTVVPGGLSFVLFERRASTMSTAARITIRATRPPMSHPRRPPVDPSPSLPSPSSAP
jgi:hypothetical protein